MSKILHLTLKKEYFDAILQGSKKIEYREVKFYWVNGYSKSAPSFTIELKSIEVQKGIKAPLGEGNFFALHLGDII